MTIIFIRHGDPNYVDDCLTEKGKREAELLSERVKGWEIDDFYCSPLGRARETADHSMRKNGRSYEILPWLEEFPARVISYENGEKRIPWDLLPAYWTKEEEYFHRTAWTDAQLMKTGDTEEKFLRVCKGIDALTEKYGYIHENGFYRVRDDGARDKVIVCFCHFAVTSVIMSYMLNLSPAVMLHGFFMPTTSVTVLAAEEREQGNAYFRCQMLGDTYHLKSGGEPVSQSGYFGKIFQG